MSAQNREKEGTELNLPEKLPICTPPHLAAVRSQETPDPNISATCDARSSSAASPVKSSVQEKSLKRPREVSRCSGSGCRKRIGLMGFRCRCGDMFCSEHRYSDRHDCSFDYKAAGREAIARENPVVRAAKLLKV